MAEDKPTKPAGATSGEGTALRPTIVKPPVADTRARKKATASSSGATPPLSAPTSVPGVKRERLDATAETLRALSPGVPASVCDAALRLVREIAPARLDDRKVVLWGHELQKSYSDRVTQTFALAQDAAVEQARGYVSRMMDILGAIDLLAVCGHSKGGVLGSLSKAMSTRIDTPRELAAALDELRLLLERTAACIDRLLTLRERLQRHADAIRQVEVDVEAAALAALHLSQHFKRASPEVAQRFAERSMSLTATLAQLRQGKQIQRLQIEQPLQLIAAIQNVALVSLPGCVAGMAALLTLAIGKGASPTEARDLSYQLRDLTDQLRT